MGDKPRVSVLAAGLLAWAAAGCGGGEATGLPPADASAGTDAEPAPVLEASSADSGWMPLVSGGTIAAYRGPQGGFHVFIGLRATGLAPGTRGEASRLCTEPGTFQSPCVSIDVFDLDDARQLDNFVALRVPLIETEEGGPGVYNLPPRLISLAITGLDQVDGHHFRVVASVEDVLGERASVDLTVTCAAVR